MEEEEHKKAAPSSQFNWQPSLDFMFMNLSDLIMFYWSVLPCAKHYCPIIFKICFEFKTTKKDEQGGKVSKFLEIPDFVYGFLILSWQLGMNSVI